MIYLAFSKAHMVLSGVSPGPTIRWAGRLGSCHPMETSFSRSTMRESGLN